MMPCRSSLVAFGKARKGHTAFTEGPRVKAMALNPADRQQTVNFVNDVYTEGSWV